MGALIKRKRAGDTDHEFIARCVHAWGISQRFDGLVTSITPDPIAEDTEHAVLDDVRRIARMVFDEAPLVRLELIGSVSHGTDILKADGQQSDRDYSFGRSVTPEEWQVFCCLLAAAPGFRRVAKGDKAIQFRHVASGNVCWELVPADGLFTFDMVEFPSLFGTTSRSRWRAILRSFFAAHPGARKATRVLKRLLPEFRGYILEGLVYRQVQTRLRRGEVVGHTGMLICEDIALMLFSYPHQRDSALSMLMKDARQVATRAESLEGSIASAKSKIKLIFDATSTMRPPACDANACQIIVFQAALILCLVFFLVLVALPHIQKWDAFKAPQPWKTLECRDNSCFCVDCFGGRDPTKSYECELWWGLTTDRCTLALIINAVSIGCFGMVLFYAYSAVQWAHSREHACKPMLWVVLLSCIFNSLRMMTVFDIPLLQRLLRHHLTEQLLFVLDDVGLMSISVTFLVAPVSQYSTVLERSLWSSFVPSYFLFIVIVYSAGQYCFRYTENDMARHNYICFTFGLVLQAAITACAQWRQCTRIQCCVGELTFAHVGRAASNLAYFALRKFSSEFHMSKYLLLLRLAQRFFSVYTLVVIVKFVRLVQRSAERVEPAV